MVLRRCVEALACVYLGLLCLIQRPLGCRLATGRVLGNPLHDVQADGAWLSHLERSGEDCSGTPLEGRFVLDLRVSERVLCFAVFIACDGKCGFSFGECLMELRELLPQR